MSNLRMFILFLISITLIGCGFAEVGGSSYYDAPGFFSGIWHGLLSTLDLNFKTDFRYRNVCFPKFWMVL